MRRGDTIAFRGLGVSAGVALGFTYHAPDNLRRVEQLRAQQQITPPAPPERPDPDEPSSVIRTLTTQLADLKRRHRDEVHALNQALEAAHGENLELRRRLAQRTVTQQG